MQLIFVAFIAGKTRLLDSSPLSRKYFATRWPFWIQLKHLSKFEECNFWWLVVTTAGCLNMCICRTKNWVICHVISWYTPICGGLAPKMLISPPLTLATTRSSHISKVRPIRKIWVHLISARHSHVDVYEVCRSTRAFQQTKTHRHYQRHPHSTDHLKCSWYYQQSHACFDIFSCGHRSREAVNESEEKWVQHEIFDRWWHHDELRGFLDEGQGIASN